MKRFLQIVSAIVVAFAAIVAYAHLQTRWDLETRRDAIDQAIEARIASHRAEAAYRNKFAQQSLQQALQSEKESAMRWQAAKERGKLPGNNTVESFDGRLTSAQNNSSHR